MLTLNKKSPIAVLKALIHTTLLCSPLVLAGCGGGEQTSNSATITPTSTSNTSQVSWEQVASPTLDFRPDQSPGAELFKKLVPSPQNYLREIAQNVARTLYQQANEVPAFSTLELHIERWENEPNGVAWKAGDPPRITVNVNAYYLEKIAAQGVNVAEEVKGILYHEMTHAYQHSSGMDLPAVEGLADTVRYLNGYIPISFRRPGGKWTDSYKTTAFFFAWLQEKKGYKSFTYCFNQQAKPGNTNWSWNNAIAACTAQADLSSLWNEYQTWLINGAH